MMPFSNTVSICDPDAIWPVVTGEMAKNLSAFGEVARIDTSVGALAQCILVTFFDVRSVQRLLSSKQFHGQAEPFYPESHDCRSLRVNLVAFAEKTDHLLGGFSQFGEVANIQIQNGEAFVEFFDIRSAQKLMAAARGTAVPLVPESGNFAATFGSFCGELQGGFLKDHMRQMTRPASHEEQSQLKPAAVDRNSRAMRAKVASKDFRMYDIDTDKILAGTDSRSTVMVRNIFSGCSRKDFLHFLEKCSLGDRFSFFYMPYKEHGNSPTGLAFINFKSPHDVLLLYTKLQSGMWQECGFGPNAAVKVPQLSFARYQGHQELVNHFSSSAVLHEKDPERRPIFRSEVLEAAEPYNGSAQLQEPMSISDGFFTSFGFDDNQLERPSVGTLVAVRDVLKQFSADSRPDDCISPPGLAAGLSPASCKSADMPVYMRSKLMSEFGREVSPVAVDGMSPEYGA